MSVLAERTAMIEPPSTYQQWLDCFALLRSQSGNASEIFEMASKGTFRGTDTTNVALQQQLIETVNAVLDKSAKRFIRELNTCISFNDLTQVNILFLRLKKDIHHSLFFEKLFFLPQKFRSELSDSVKKQMTKFWNDTIRFLYEQSLEYSNSDLEDVLFLIKRIHLF